ncbi:hypothetical protein OIE66_07545 [Nonomuraea sp. NBC_01738]|uniref:hypothetical protein n=1 Tax=Nonomuraea sp. NBC_01738 TaxID=2976003 RepID=UPI002E0FF865|nr:hypothetical protein OIE66_07545 [Nonomuraea sp. NBC_01738]
MSAVSTHRAEEEQLQRLGWVQDRLAGSGIRSLLVRRLRLILEQNRYLPAEPEWPLLVAGDITISVDAGRYLVHNDTMARFDDPGATADYVSSLIAGHLGPRIP